MFKSPGFKQSFLLLCVCNQVDIEPASRNQQVVGGKKQKRKRGKKEVAKAPRRKKKGTAWALRICACDRIDLEVGRLTRFCVFAFKEPKKRTPAHDEADHQALKMMTRQRVYWSIQEDSLMMLCNVAAHLLNSKVRTQPGSVEPVV